MSVDAAGDVMRGRRLSTDTLHPEVKKIAASMASGFRRGTISEFAVPQVQLPVDVSDCDDRSYVSLAFSADAAASKELESTPRLQLPVNMSGHEDSSCVALFYEGKKSIVFSGRANSIEQNSQLADHINFMAIEFFGKLSPDKSIQERYLNEFYRDIGYTQDEFTRGYVPITVDVIKRVNQAFQKRMPSSLAPKGRTESISPASGNGCCLLQ